MISAAQARHFAEAWVQAWNAHDLPAILAHYTDDFEMSSPYIAQLAGEASGMLKGKTEVAAYWAGALEKYPTLRFELLQVLAGVSSVVIYYRGVRGLVAEVFYFNVDGLVERASAHHEV